MANILQRYGIKEVADVTFIDITTEKPVLYLDTLKVSTIEETAEQAEARGGKGNAPLVVWDYGKEITVNIEDALYSPKSMTLMHSSKLSALHVYDSNATKRVIKYKNFTVVSDTSIKKADYITVGETAILSSAALTIGTDGKVGTVDFGRKVGLNANEYINGSARLMAVYDPNGINVTATKFEAGNTYTLEYEVQPTNKSYIEISASSFPGTYKVVGDTWARGKGSSEDQYFQFEIAEAKISAETTITLEAEGDPSVFNMTLKVLRPDNGVMMKLIQYDFAGVDNTGDDSITSVHSPGDPDRTATKGAWSNQSNNNGTQTVTPGNGGSGNGTGGTTGDGGNGTNGETTTNP